MIYPYTFDNQFEKYIGQFMRVFSGFQTKDGVTRDGDDHLKRVPIVYGNMSRVVASVLNNRESFSSSVIPMMAANLASIEADDERKKPSAHHDSIAITKNDTKVALERLNGPPFNMNMELSIYASSTTEMFSIMEQILLIFNPRVSIQVDNKIANSDYITEISLTGIQPEIQYPMGQNKDIIMMTLTFKVPVRLRYPYATDGNVINEIMLNIFDDSAEGIPIESMIIDENGSRRVEDI